jgi:hypothetical protein
MASRRPRILKPSVKTKDLDFQQYFESSYSPVGSYKARVMQDGAIGVITVDQCSLGVRDRRRRPGSQNLCPQTSSTPCLFQRAKRGSFMMAFLVFLAQGKVPLFKVEVLCRLSLA